MSTPPFDMSKMAMGGLGQMLDSVEFVKRAWSSMSLPSTLVPTVDVEELDKRITDLKAVEQWLNMNLSMLQGTIQGLEIQRGTLAAVRAFGATLGATGAALGAAGATPDAGGSAAQRRADAAVQAMERAAAPRRKPRPDAPPVADAPAVRPGPPDKARHDGSADRSRTGTHGAAGDRSKAAPGDAASAAGDPPKEPAGASLLGGINPGAWWNLLQQNFNQVAESALSGVGLQSPAHRKAASASAAAAGGKRPAAGKPAPGKRVAGKRATGANRAGVNRAGASPPGKPPAARKSAR